MIGTVVNTALVIAGSIIGMVLRRSIPDRINKIIMVGLGLFTCVLGVKMSIGMERPLIVILSVILGSVCGEFLRIEDHLDGLAERLKRLVRARGEVSFVQGFVFASLLFCVGPMTILGSIQAGIQNDPELLFIKSLMDGVSSVILASTLGLGVLFSAATVFVIQGGLTMLARQFSFLTAPQYLSDFTAVGGIMILAIGLKLLDIKTIRVANLLPALVFIIFLTFIAGLL